MLKLLTLVLAIVSVSACTQRAADQCQLLARELKVEEELKNFSSRGEAILRQVDMALEKCPSDEKLLRFSFFGNVRVGDWPAALLRYESLANAGLADHEMHAEAAFTYLKLQDHLKASSSFRSALVDQRALDLLVGGAEADLALGRAPEAIALLEEAMIVVNSHDPNRVPGATMAGANSYKEHVQRLLAQARNQLSTEGGD